MAILFVILCITGVLMLFHVRVPLMSFKFLHIIMGLAFIVLGSIHLVLNWTKFKSYLMHRSVVIALVLGIFVSLALSFLGPTKTDGRHEFHGDLNNGGEVRMGINE